MRRLAEDQQRDNATTGPEVVIHLAPWNAAFIEIPKVACTSLKSICARLLDISLEPSGGDPHRVQYPRPDPAVSPDGPLFPGLFTFAFVRNPWDRLVSCYRDKVRGEVDGYTHFTIRPGVANCLARFDAFVAGMSFEDFVIAVASIPDAAADRHFRSQHTFVTNGAGKIAVDFVGRYESLLRDFQVVREKIGLPDIVLPRLQAARESVRYPTFYSPRIRDLVAERFRRDIEIFGYQFDSETSRGASA